MLGDELATEEKLLAEARAAYADGAPSPLPEERADAEKYRQRIARLRQAVGLHERNIEALQEGTRVDQVTRTRRAIARGPRRGRVFRRGTCYANARARRHRSDREASFAAP